MPVEALGSLGDGITGGCEMPNVGTRDGTGRGCVKVFFIRCS